MPQNNAQQRSGSDMFMAYDGQRKKPIQYERAKVLQSDSVLNYVSKQSTMASAPRQYLHVDANQSSMMQQLPTHNAKRK